MITWYINNHGELYYGDMRPGDSFADPADAATHEANLVKASRKVTIKAELADIDERGRRALRELALPEEVVDAAKKEAARGILVNLETQARALRAEFAALGA